jgi:DNA polymerase III subunit gamma/tau
MENYIVSARKYRPETFQTVIGQPSVATTLKNAIRSKQLAHAYLFCGPRGVGKTTCARILAKTINCFELTGDTEACNKCESCLSFNSSRSFNIHELDAASNNSVDDIRNLIDQIRIPPQVAKYSIYIIDEVHMLSSSAFNAFLKTLEEPPAHAIFILATTEKHKILPTILSRCQVFDFNRIKTEDIVAHLERIALSENISAENEGLNIIAQKADGAMRDALSIFDQLTSFTGGKITYQTVIDNLNILDYDYYFRITESVLKADIASTLMLFNEVLEKGFDGQNFINGLSRHFRDLLVCQDEITLELLEAGAGIREKYRIQAKACKQEFLIGGLSLTNQCDLTFRSSKSQRLHVELCLVQLCGLLTLEKKKSEPYPGRLKDKKPDSPGQEPSKDKKPDSPGQEPSKEKMPDSPGQEPSKSQDNHLHDTSARIKTTGDAANPGGEGIFNGSNAGNTYSIKNALKGTINSEAEETGEELPESDSDEEIIAVQENYEDFTEKELIEQWKKFANQISNDHPRLFNTLMANKPEIISQTSISFLISNPLQEEALNKIKPELLSHLKRVLNSDIRLEFCISETFQENNLYLPEDKYQKMVGKNPDLARFRQRFNLDFE